MNSFIGFTILVLLAATIVSLTICWVRKLPNSSSQTVCPKCKSCPPQTVCPKCKSCPPQTVCPECKSCPPQTVCPKCPPQTVCPKIPTFSPRCQQSANKWYWIQVGGDPNNPELGDNQQCLQCSPGNCCWYKPGDLADCEKQLAVSVIKV